MDWIKATDRLPAESGEYWTAREVMGGYLVYGATFYSARHKAFNAFDSLADATSAVPVDYWAHIEPPGGVGE